MSLRRVLYKKTVQNPELQWYNYVIIMCPVSRWCWSVSNHQRLVSLVPLADNHLHSYRRGDGKAVKYDTKDEIYDPVADSL